MKVKRRTLFWIIAGALILLLAALAFRPRPVEVDTARVTVGALRSVIEGEARTRVRNLYVITAPIPGNLQRINLASGDSVERGATLARIAPAPLDPQTMATAKARLEAAEAARAEAQTRVQQAGDVLALRQRSYDRLQSLYDAGAISLQQLELAEQEVRQAKDEFSAAGNRLTAAAADVSAAQAALVSVDAVAAGASLISIQAPASGRVLRIPQLSQRVVAAGTPIMEIGSPSSMEVVIDVLSTDAVRVREENRVELTGWGGDSTLHATVHTIEPAATTQISALGVEEQRVNIIARFTQHPGGLGDGFRADARIIIWESDSVLSVPMSALFRSGDAWSSYVIRDRKARLVSVIVGHTSESAAEVLSGLVEGDEVVLFPSDRIADGVSVRPR
jgi:HlyD family secretion protein